jgi:hypothetical protein
MTATTGVTTTGVIVVMIATTTSVTTEKMTDAMIDVASTTYQAKASAICKR